MERPQDASTGRIRVRWARWLWRIPVTVVVLMVVELLLSAGILQFKRMRIERSTYEAELTQEPFRNADWARAYWDELGHYEPVWEPYVVARVGSMSGRNINVVDGVRRTYRTAGPPGLRRPTIFVFGGSAAWGHGARDDRTLPSWLARVAEEHGSPLDVRNYAESGWVNWQGVVYLNQLLASGERPDVVIFYSGVNELLSARQWPTQYRPIWDGDIFPQAMEAIVTQRYRPLTRVWDLYRDTSFIMTSLAGGPRTSATPTPGPTVLGPKVAADYAADMRLVENLGRVHGFSTMFVWQLSVADKPSLSAQERGYAGWLPDASDSKPPIDWWVMPEILRQEYTLAGSQAKREGAIDISNAFADMSETAFIDWMHPSEAGNERIARALHERLLPVLAGSQADSAATTRPPLASLTASPMVRAGSGLGKTTIAWATRDGSSGEVYVSINGGPEVLFAGISPFGSQDADWIQPGSTYEFRLYAGAEHNSLLASVFVTRVPAPAGGK